MMTSTTPEPLAPNSAHGPGRGPKFDLSGLCVGHTYSVPRGDNPHIVGWFRSSRILTRRHWRLTRWYEGEQLLIHRLPDAQSHGRVLLWGRPTHWLNVYPWGVTSHPSQDIADTVAMPDRLGPAICVTRDSPHPAPEPLESDAALRARLLDRLRAWSQALYATGTELDALAARAGLRRRGPHHPQQRPPSAQQTPGD